MPMCQSTQRLTCAASLLSAFLFAACDATPPQPVRESKTTQTPIATQAVPLTPRQKIVANALAQTTQTVSYDPAYVALSYPNGDVPVSTGVCADVVVRAFRGAGVDLQKEIHEDMKRAFAKYPNKWGAKGTDSNIDHRRVPNLMTWFARQQKSLPVSEVAAAYQPGDVVAWELNQDTGQLHIGLVSDSKVEGTDRYAIIHNISSGARLADVLFAWKIIGHYRYFTDEKPIRTRPNRKKIKN